MIKEKFNILIEKLRDETLKFYGERLVSLAIFGSVASETMLPDSDLDLFICVEGLPRGRRSRLEEFMEIEDRMGAELLELRTVGINTSLSPVIKTPEETRLGSLIFIDMTDNVRIVYDKDSFLRIYLNSLKNKLLKLGSRKIKLGSAWFWDLIPDYKSVRKVDL